MRAFWILALCCWSSFVQAKRSKISDFSEIDLGVLTERSLFVTDVNDTIVTCDDGALRPSAIELLPEVLAKRVKAWDRRGTNIMAQLLVQKCRNIVHGSSDKALKKLKERNIPHLALTAAIPADLAGVNMLKHISDDLQANGLVFMPQPKDLSAPRELAFENLLTDRVSGVKPRLVNGVLFAAGADNDKGTVLKAYLEKTGQKPDRIVFVDDGAGNLDSVEAKFADITLDTYQIVSTLPKPTKLEPEQIAVWEALVTETERILAAN